MRTPGVTRIFIFLTHKFKASVTIMCMYIYAAAIIFHLWLEKILLHNFVYLMSIFYIIYIFNLELLKNMWVPLT